MSTPTPYRITRCVRCPRKGRGECHVVRGNGGGIFGTAIHTPSRESAEIIRQACREGREVTLEMYF